jgi:DNA-binding IclR family transcriptional regulator
MNKEVGEIATHLSGLLNLAQASARAMPELLCISDRATLLVAIALADAEGTVSVEAWAERTGTSVTILDRYAKAFEELGFVTADGFDSGEIRLKPAAIERLRAALQSGVEK